MFFSGSKNIEIRYFFLTLLLDNSDERMIKMVRILLFTFCFLAVATTYAQPDNVWAFMIGDPDGNEYVGYDVAVDAGGDVYATGYFVGTTNFNPAGTANLSSSGSADVYLAKYTTAGVYVWALKIGSAGDDRGRAVTVDSNGDVYLTGTFTGTANFNPAGTYNLISSGTDIFVAKYTSAGAFVWALNIGSAGTDHGYDIVTGPSDTVFVTGDFTGTADFDPVGTANLVSAGAEDIFVAKYTSAGVYVSAFNLGSTGTDIGQGIAVNPSNGNVHVTGSISATVNFNLAGTYTLTSLGSGDIFLATYNNQNAFQWAFAIGNSYGDDVSYGVAVDGNNNISITGKYTGSFGSPTDFDPDAGTANLVTGVTGTQDIFIAQYTSAGAYRWVVKRGQSSSSVDVGYRIAVDGNANVYMTAVYALGGYISYVEKLNSSGTSQWNLQIAGAINDVNGGRGIAVDGSGYVYVTGYFNSTANFNPNGSPARNITTNGTAGYVKPFLAKYGLSLMPVELRTFSGKCQPTLDPTQKRITLNWSTASETNNNYFNIQRSKDPSSAVWETLGTVNGGGNSSTIRDYEFIDNSEAGNHISHMLYYRLKQTDYDGKSEYFGPIAISPECSGGWEFSVVNNPVANNELSCTLTVPDDDQVEFQVFDISGQLLSSGSLNVVKGSNWIQLSVVELASGMYFVKAFNKEKSFVSRFVKSR